jgi:hypothetical protein
MKSTKACHPAPDVPARCTSRESDSIARRALIAVLLVTAATATIAGVPPSPTSSSQSHPFVASSAVGWVAHNPDQRLTLGVSNDGVSVRDLANKAEREVRFVLVAEGSAGADAPPAGPSATMTDDTVVLRRGDLTESYRNTRQGLEVGLLLAHGPDERIAFRYALIGTPGAKPTVDGRLVILTDPHGIPILEFSRLIALDADGRDVDVSWESADPAGDLPGGFVIRADARDHRYPLTLNMLLARRADTAGAVKPGRPADEDAAPTLLAVPANDQCGGAEVIPAAGPFPYLSQSHRIADATSAGDPPSPSCQPLVSRSIWFKFVPAASGDFTLSLCSDAPTSTTVEDTVLAVYTSSDATCGGTFTELAGYCDDDSCGAGDFQSVLTGAPLQAGTTYYIVAYLFDTLPPPPSAETIQLRVSKAAARPPPPNDTCAGAEPIPGAGPFPYLTALAMDITGATATGDPPAPSCQPSVSRSIWYAFTPAESGSYRISSCAEAPTGTTVDDTVLAVYSSSNGLCSGVLTPVGGGCDNDSCGVEPAQAVLAATPLTAGTTYYIVAYKAGPIAPATGNTAVQLRVEKNPPGPENDMCSGSVVIPGGGPFPVLSAVTPDITWATSAGDPPPPSCQMNVSRSVWYRFTPQASGAYSVSVCAEAPTATTVDDTVLAIYASSDGGCGGVLSQVTGACDDDSCSGEANQSVSSPVNLAAGVTYFILVHQYGPGAPGVDNTAVQVRIGLNEPPLNDRCSAASTLALDTPLAGKTVLAAADYQLSGSACFTGVGQAASTAPGRDVAFEFTAPFAGLYSFRITRYSTASNPVLYVANDCPAAPAVVGGCLKAANRNVSSSAEEVDCLGLATAQRVLLYVDEHTDSAGSEFTVEVNQCDLESEPNETPAAADALACDNEGSIATSGDVDFFTLGAPAAGSRVFAVVDGVGGNSQDFDLRVTSATDTLEYDDANNDVFLGGLAPNVAGTILTGAATYLKVSHFSATTRAEPYRLYAAVQPPSSAAAPEVEPNDTIAQATLGASLYFSGTLSTTSDVDVFGLDALAGQLLVLGADLDPTRDSTPFNGILSLLDTSGATIVVANDNASMSNTTSGAGTLSASTPFSPGEAIIHRVRSTGRYYVKVAWAGGTPGDYLLSIARPCGADSDGDGAFDRRDCAPADASVWSVPSPASELRFPSSPANKARLAWSAPASPGAAQVRYDLLRSHAASNFGSPACVAKDTIATTTEDSSAPPSLGAMYFYLVRVKNACGTNVGAASNGIPRVAGACP